MVCVGAGALLTFSITGSPLTAVLLPLAGVGISAVTKRTTFPRRY
jgi:hypothetical protein